MDQVAETDTLILYYSEKSTGGYGPMICLTDKVKGTNWFSTPINTTKDQTSYDEAGEIIAQYSSPKSSQLNSLKSTLEIAYGDTSTRNNKTANNYKNADVVSEPLSNGIKITYTFEVVKEVDNGDGTVTPALNFVIPVTYTLEDGYLKVSIVTGDIAEQDATKLLTKLSVLKQFGAADIDDEGYFVIPDGSGALIEFNNGKTISPSYSGDIYGTDVTKKENTVSAYTKNVEFPMYGIVKNGAGLMAVAAKGDAQATVNTYVAGQTNKVYYNSTYFDFITRTNDVYAISSSENDFAKTVIMYELYGIKVPEIEVRYYPVGSDDGDVDYVDIATKYREYLMTEKGMTPTATVSETPLYVDFYGGVMKRRSILGIPIELQYKVTGFDEATDILEGLKGEGVGDMVATYINYTADNIKREVSTSGAPASVLGGKGDFNRFLDYAEGAGVSVYPSVSNVSFTSGNGYNTVLDSALRVTGQFSRSYVFDLAHRVPNQYYDTESLLSPLAYSRMFNQLTKKYTNRDYTGIALGDTANTLYGDYGRDHSSRTAAMETVVEGYSQLRDAGLSVLASDASQYVLPFADHITNVPLESSGYDMFDQDVPFYQIAMYGLRPVATIAVNGEPRLADTLLKAIACGSNLKFDMIGISADKIKDTRFDNLYYANADNWIATAADAWRFHNDILGDVSGSTITGYETDGDVITTTFSNGTVLVTNLSDRTVSKNGTVYDIYTYIGKEIIG
jgi:hypothetical protein